MADDEQVLSAQVPLLETEEEIVRGAQREWMLTRKIPVHAADGMVADSAAEVLRDADTAMYEAKLAGKGRFVVFDIVMRERVVKRLNLEHDLRQALDAGQLFLLYQPIISLQTGELEGLEALVRWKHPQRGLISPGEFIPIAEDTSLILPIGEWVLREAWPGLGGVISA